ncbi:MAG: transposase family protein [Candidatus Sumerlaeia bacterium]|nr:transposase family protein [Candidatus Sumerlaeia bacterium]
MSLPRRRRQGHARRVLRWRGAPGHIRSDNGPEFLAQAIRETLAVAGVETLSIAPGAPWENGYAESFNGKVRDELLNAEEFTSLLEAQVLGADWKRGYNTRRPHSDGATCRPASSRRSLRPPKSRRLGGCLRPGCSLSQSSRRLSQRVVHRSGASQDHGRSFQRKP